MKVFSVFFVSLLSTFWSLAEQPTWQQLSERAFTNASIVWQATNNLPKTFWIYRRNLPKTFPTSLVEKAMAIGSLQGKRAPKPSTNSFYISEDRPHNYPGPIAEIFCLIPSEATITYCMPCYGSGSGNDLPNDGTILSQTKKYAAELGLQVKDLFQNPIFSQICENETKVGPTNCDCGRGVYLSRVIDGVSFYSGDNKGAEGEGFTAEFGSHGQMRSFYFRWSDLVRHINQPASSPRQIIGYIRAHKTIVVPDDEGDYFAKLKALAGARKFTITKITPYYGDGIFGEIPTDNRPSQFATPFVELDGIAQIGNTNTTIHLLSPVISPQFSPAGFINGPD